MDGPGDTPDAHLRDNGGGDARVAGESRERQGRDDLELSSPAGNVDQVAPEAVERPPRVRARTLRTQQRTESQRQTDLSSLFPLRGSRASFGALRD